MMQIWYARHGRKFGAVDKSNVQDINGITRIFDEDKLRVKAMKKSWGFAR